MLLQAYEQVSQLLGRVDFSAIWPGFAEAPFALYNDAVAVAGGRCIPTPPEFLGNTAIFWEGAHWAIWRYTPPEEPIRLAASLVHEMFHANQYAAGDSRFPDDLALLTVPATSTLLSHRFWEGQYLLEALDAPDPQAARQCLAKFCALRRRYAGAPWFQSVCLVETAEGMAVYAELRALEQLSPPDFSQALAGIRAKLGGRALLDPRRTGYLTGPVLLLAAEKAGLTMEHRLGGCSRPLFSLLEEQLPRVSPPAVQPESRLEALAQEDAGAKALQVARFLAQGPRQLPGPFRITGYDPMNQFLLDSRLFCTHFLMLDGVLYSGPCLLELEPGSTNRGRRLWLP